MKKLLLLLIIPLLSFGQDNKKLYYKNGNLKSELIYYGTDDSFGDAICDELHKNYYENGQLSLKRCYHYDRMEEYYEWHENGSLKTVQWTEKKYINEGEFDEMSWENWYLNIYYKNSKIKTQAKYSDGIGLYDIKCWDESGNVIFAISVGDLDTDSLEGIDIHPKCN
tara:strand:- start:122 stop:622 length:501 start_codon:yes stop_codon:yes gene_type:complete